MDTRTEVHWQRRMQCYTDRPSTVDAAFRAAAAAMPQAEAVLEGTTRHSYEKLNALVDRLAVGLWKRGVRQGDRVAVFLGNGFEAILSVLGIARLGAVLVPVGSRL